MNDTPPALRSVVIVGGGTAGWMCAAAMSAFLNDGQRTFTLVESDDIGTVGVGEATIPPIVNFNRLLGISEPDFVSACQATFKLGIEFAGWGAPGERYFHPFGRFGQDLQGVAFHQFWLKHRHSPGVPPLSECSMSQAAAMAGRFAPPSSDPRQPLSTLAYAYHFDATLYARLLRTQAEGQGTRRIEGRIVEAERDGETGHVTAVVLEDGRRIEGELFVDCSGFRSMLLGETMEVGYRDWSHWLPCDRALAVPSERTQAPIPYTRSTAHPNGWQWRIPLQHRTGNGLVYASAHLSDDEAAEQLLAHLDAPALGEPRLLRFKAGVRERMWEKNVVGIGLASGFLEPLESTSIHLIQTGISKLLWLFPDSSLSEVERNEYNRLMTAQFEAVRDFIILHYHATTREDGALWRYTRAMPIPGSLAHKIALFREKGRVLRYDDELFDVPNWIAVMLGQNIEPRGYDPMVDSMDDTRVIEALGKIAAANREQARRMPMHEEYIRHLSAPRAEKAHA